MARTGGYRRRCCCCLVLWPRRRHGRQMWRRTAERVGDGSFTSAIPVSVSRFFCCEISVNGGGQWGANDINTSTCLSGDAFCIYLYGFLHEAKKWCAPRRSGLIWKPHDDHARTGCRRRQDQRYLPTKRRRYAVYGREPVDAGVVTEDETCVVIRIFCNV